MLPHREPIRDGGRIIDPRRNGGDDRLRRPTVGWDNRPLTHRPYEDRYHRALPPGREHFGIINHTVIVGNIRGVQGGWDARDHGYYWHEWNGTRLCHHYDELGFHWWGFYVADTYFWTRYYNDNYWWYDPYWHRWVYLRDNHWWWQDPARVDIVYIYRDGGYYRYEDGVGGVILSPDQTAPVTPPPGPAPAPNPSPNPAPEAESKEFYSLDGTRTVQVYGANKDAFLYDTAETPAFEPKWLASGVTDARFKLDADGNLQQILLLTDGASFSLFDKDGEPVNTVAETAPLDALSSDEPKAPEGAASRVNASESFGALASGSLGW